MSQKVLIRKGLASDSFENIFSEPDVGCVRGEV